LGNWPIDAYLHTSGGQSDGAHVPDRTKPKADWHPVNTCSRRGVTKLIDQLQRNAELARFAGKKRHSVADPIRLLWSQSFPGELGNDLTHGTFTHLGERSSRRQNIIIQIQGGSHKSNIKHQASDVKSKLNGLWEERAFNVQHCPALPVALNFSFSYFFDHLRQRFLEIPFGFKAKHGFDFLGTEPGPLEKLKLGKLKAEIRIFPKGVINFY
jgi:hypothetical protein